MLEYGARKTGSAQDQKITGIPAINFFFLSPRQSLVNRKIKSFIPPGDLNEYWPDSF